MCRCAGRDSAQRAPAPETDTSSERSLPATTQPPKCRSAGQKHTAPTDVRRTDSRCLRLLGSMSWSGRPVSAPADVKRAETARLNVSGDRSCLDAPECRVAPPALACPGRDDPPSTRPPTRMRRSRAHPSPRGGRYVVVAAGAATAPVAELGVPVGHEGAIVQVAGARGHPGAFNGPPSPPFRMAELFGFSLLCVRKPGSVRRFAWPSGRMPGPSDVRLSGGPIAGLPGCPEAET